MKKADWTWLSKYYVWSIWYGLTFFKYNWLGSFFKYNRKNKRKPRTQPVRFSGFRSTGYNRFFSVNRVYTRSQFYAKKLWAPNYPGDYWYAQASVNVSPKRAGSRKEIHQQSLQTRYLPLKLPHTFCFVMSRGGRYTLSSKSLRNTFV